MPPAFLFVSEVFDVRVRGCRLMSRVSRVYSESLLPEMSRRDVNGQPRFAFAFMHVIATGSAVEQALLPPDYVIRSYLMRTGKRLTRDQRRCTNFYTGYILIKREELITHGRHSWTFVHVAQTYTLSSGTKLFPPRNPAATDCVGAAK